MCALLATFLTMKIFLVKTLIGIKVVQVLSSLKRALPAKYDVFALDFMNSADSNLLCLKNHSGLNLVSVENTDCL
jgi:hypothetical protein